MAVSRFTSFFSPAAGNANRWLAKNSRYSIKYRCREKRGFMTDTIMNFDVDEFQRKVLNEISRIKNPDLQSDYDDWELQHLSPSSQRLKELKPRESQYSDSSLLEQRQKIYNEFQRELGNPLLFIDKRKLQTLINKLREDDSLLIEKINRQYHQLFEDINYQYHHNISEFENILQDIYERKVRGKAYDRQAAQKTEDEATKILLRKDVRKRLCPGLQSVSSDVNDIAKAITPILVPLILTGMLTIPLQPLLFAYIAVIIARMGIASICDDYKDKEAK
jgi:hypothetical protein